MYVTARVISILFSKFTIIIRVLTTSAALPMHWFFFFIAGRKESDFDVGPIGVVWRQSAQHNRRHVDRSRFLRKHHHRHIHIDRDCVRRVSTRDR